jgi:hypothetical protein
MSAMKWLFLWFVAACAAPRVYAPPIDWTLEPMPEEFHSTIFPTAALHGIRRAFAP